MQIDCFLEVARCLNYNRAAEQLYTTQPVVSYQIKSLERELKVQLFLRDNRNVSLTEAGSYLYRQLDPMQKQLETIIATAQKIQNGASSVITLLVRRLADYSSLTEIIHFFSEQYPNVQVDIVTRNEISTRSLLAQNKIQLAFCYQFETIRDPAIHFLALSETYYYVLVSPRHPLAAYKALTWEDLAGEKLILADTELQKNPRLITLKELTQKKIQVRSS